MLVKNATLIDVYRALRIVNEKYEGNIEFNNLQKQGSNSIRVTLRVRDSKAKGHRISHTGRRLPNACWHVHGDFFNALLGINDKAIIETANAKIFVVNNPYGKHIVGNWQDWNIGSLMEPLYYSEACECE